MKPPALWITAPIIAIWTVVCWPAYADAGPVAVVAEGPGAKQVRAAVLKVVPAELAVVDSARFRVELVRAGLVKGAGNLDVRSIRALRRAAVAVGAKAVVVARVISVVPSSRTLRIVVIDVDADLPRTEIVTLGPKPADTDSEPIGAAMSGAFDPYLPPRAPATTAAEPPAPPAPEPPPPAAEPAPADAAAVPVQVQPPTPAPLTATGILDIAVGPEVAGRAANYRNGISSRPYTPSAGVIFGARVSGQVYPLAPTRGLWRDLGLHFDYERLFLSTSLSDAAISYSVGLRGRTRLGGRRSGSPVVLGLSASYAFSWSASLGPVAGQLPATTYRTIRPGVDVRIPLGRVSLLAEGAFRVVANSGSIAPAFFEPHGYGFDGDIGAALLFGRHVEARLIARYEAYALRVRAIPGTTASAGNVFDQRFGGIAAIAVLL